MDEVLKKSGFSTVNGIIDDILWNILSEIDDIAKDLNSGNWSNSEIYDRLQELKDKIC